MKKIAAAFIIASLLVHTSCKDKSKQAGREITLSGYTEIKLTPNGESRMLLSDIAETINIINLESTDGSMIGSVKKIEYDDGFYFCQDGMTGVIYCFGVGGDFITKIGRKGRGPGEYISPSAFSLNKDANEVWVIDNGAAIKKYTYSGDFIETQDMPKLFMSDFRILDNTLACYTAKTTNWLNDGTDDYWCNELTLIRNNRDATRYLPVDKELFPIENRTTVPEPTPFSDMEGSIAFHHTVSNVVYSIDKESKGVSPKFMIDFGDKAYKEDISQMTTMDMLEYIGRHPNMAGLVNNVIETDSFLHFRYTFKTKNTNRAIYNKTSKNIKYGEPVNDVFTSGVRLLGQRDNKLIGCVDDISSLKFTDAASVFFSEEEIERLKQTDIYSNAVLVEIGIKNF